MLQGLLEEEALACPACRRWEGETHIEHPLRLGSVAVREGAWIVQGFLVCAGCTLRFPILDGVPIVVPDVGAWLRQQERSVFWRADLASGLSQWLHGAWPDDQDPNWKRELLATYAATWASLPGVRVSRVWPPGPVQTDPSLVRSRQQAWVCPGARVLDAGTGAGTEALAMAQQGARVVALDHEFGPLRALSTLLRTGRCTAPQRRHSGRDYVDVDVELEGLAGAVLPLVADALNPPFRARRFEAVTAYNLLDNVAEPVLLLRQLQAMLPVGGRLTLASPYDWSPACTPTEQRLGEAIRARAGDPPDPAQALREVLSGTLGVAAGLSLEVVHEGEFPWVVRRHDRSWHVFRCDFVEALRVDGTRAATPTPVV